MVWGSFLIAAAAPKHPRDMVITPEASTSLFTNSTYFEYRISPIYLEYVLIHVIYRVNQAEYVIHILVVAPQ